MTFTTKNELDTYVRNCLNGYVDSFDVNALVDYVWMNDVDIVNMSDSDYCELLWQFDNANVAE